MVSQSRPVGAAGRRGVPRGMAARVAAAMIAVGVLAGLAACGSTAADGSGQPAAAGATHSTEPASAASASAGVPLCAAAGTVDQVVASLMPGHLSETVPGGDPIRDAARVRALAAALCALPPRPARLHCPAAFGGSVQLVFTAGARRFPPVVIRDLGCPSVTGIGLVRSWSWSSQAGRLLAKAVGAKGGLGPTSVPAR